MRRRENATNFVLPEELQGAVDTVSMTTDETGFLDTSRASLRPNP
jgi:hypothetical protein